MSEITRVRLGSMLAQTARQWRRAVNVRLQPYGLTEATWLPLLRLARAETPMRQKDLAASLGLDGSSVVRLLDALQAAGLVERRESADDRRAKAIVLTPQGQATVEQVERIAGQVRDEALNGIPESDIERTYELLQLLCSRFAEETREEGVSA
jgi:MarR family transcriptional regulator for hemolysin